MTRFSPSRSGAHRPCTSRPAGRSFAGNFFAGNFFAGRSSAGSTLAASALALSLLACGAPDQATEVEVVTPRLPAKPPNLLLVTVDTLRADRLSAYGNERPTSPVIDRLAAEGVRFDRPAVQWPKTGPSFASMFTSTYPAQNGIVRHIGIELPCSFRMLAEELQARGYSTHAVVSNGAVASEFRFDQGFDTFVETWKLEPTGPGVDRNGAETVTALAQGVTESLDGSKPYFLWVHYLDPHYPYRAPEEWREIYDADEHYDVIRTIEIADNPNQQMVQLGSSRTIDQRTDLGIYVSRYDAEIAYTDQQIGVLLDSMEERGLLDETLLAFTSDHGESLGEHHYFFDHGRFGFQTCLRVPLLFHWPGVIEPRVVDEPVALIDLAPTLLEAAGADLPDGRWMQGRSLVPYLLTGERDDSGVVFSEAGLAPSGRWQRVVQDQDSKLIYAQAGKEQMFVGGKGQPWAFFDLVEDPEELVNQVEQRPEETERLRRLLWEHVRAEAFDVRVDAETCSDSQEMEAETEQLLRSLGYL